MKDKLISIIEEQGVKSLDEAQLAPLCAEIRDFLVQSVAKTGGHLASNLGVVELSVALSKVFDPMRDRIIYDVGHQSYVHKILTGRRARFDTMRKFGGLCGFQKPEESPSDPCVTGHASNAVSVALGMAHARTLRHENYHIIAVVGDGAMTGGMALEAISSAGASKEPMVVVLNDNTMSIARNVGGVSRHLAGLRLSAGYLGAKQRVKTRLSYLPGGKGTTRAISSFKARLKRFLLPPSIFEQMGFVYIGPVDGHDVRELCRLLQRAKQMKKPVLLHIVTQKGKGYLPSEKAPELYHGVSPFDPGAGIRPSEEKQDFSAYFGKALCQMAETDSRICAITAAMPSGTGLSEFARRYPNRFFDVGIAEQNAAGVAAGMAAQGLCPVLAIYSTFLQRAFDQLVHDIAIAGLHVVICIDRAGIVGADGATHNGVLDIAYLRAIPNITILCPSNQSELTAMLTRAIYHEKGPVALRYPRGAQGVFIEDRAEGILPRVWGEAECGLHLICYGTMVNAAIQTAELLAQSGVAAAVYKLNEISDKTAGALGDLPQAELTVVIEEVVKSGSIGELCAASGLSPLLCFDTGDRFLPHGSVDEIHRLCGLTAAQMAEQILKARGEG